jgi:hypothetical protein
MRHKKKSSNDDPENLRRESKSSRLKGQSFAVSDSSFPCLFLFARSHRPVIVVNDSIDFDAEREKMATVSGRVKSS